MNAEWIITQLDKKSHNQEESSTNELEGNKELVKQERGLDSELLKNKQVIKDIEAYAKALGNLNIIDNILVGGIEGSAALKHEMVEINLGYPKKIIIPNIRKGSIEEWWATKTRYPPYK